MLVKPRMTAVDTIIEQAVLCSRILPLWPIIGAVAVPIFAAKALYNGAQIVHNLHRKNNSDDQEIERKIRYHKERAADYGKAMLIAAAIATIVGAFLLAGVCIVLDRKKAAGEPTQKPLVIQIP